MSRANTFGTSVPLHHLGREPRAGDRLRGRRRAAAHCADRGRHPGILLDKRKPRPVALHHPAPASPTRSRSCPACSRAQVTTGTPIALLIQNVDQRSKDYGDIKDKFRPGHADYTYDEKYGIRDYRGGGRSSARETAMRVAAGAVARKVLRRRHRPSAARWCRWARTRSTARAGTGTQVERQSVLVPRPPGGAALGRAISTACARRGSSVGAVIEVVAEGVPAGLGRADLRQARRGISPRAMMSINAVQGRRDRRRLRRRRADRARRTPTRCAWQRRQGRRFLSNHAGGILGGISTGQAGRRALRGQADLARS